MGSLGLIFQPVRSQFMYFTGSLLQSVDPDSSSGSESQPWDLVLENCLRKFLSLTIFGHKIEELCILL